MRASAILRQLCRRVAGIVDLRRFAALLAAVDALVRGNVASLAAIGRRLESRARVKHRIKRIDRLLGNPRMQAEIPLWYQALASRLFQRIHRPLVLIDWTELSRGFHALVAATPFLGRALTIYAEVHPEAKLGNPKVHSRFLRRLKAILPDGLRPTVVADAGFKTPFLRSVAEQGWHFVVRLRGNGVLKRCGTTERLPFRYAFAAASCEPQRLGAWLPHAAGIQCEAEIVLGARPVPKLRGKRRSRSNDPYVRRALEPWLLATSLRDVAPTKVVDVYSQRMQIEETFRDSKSARFGWGLEHAGSRDQARFSVVLLIVALASATTMLTGAAVEQAGLVRGFQANTVRHRRVHSVFHVGVFILGHGESVTITLRAILKQHRHVLRSPRSWVQLPLAYPRQRRSSTTS